MSATIATDSDAHIFIILTCDTCGHEWGVEDYSHEDLESARAAAVLETCPQCAD